MKLCKDCHYFVEADGFDFTYKCKEPTTIKIDIVTGQEIRQGCNLLRVSEKHCGKDGKLFKQKEKQEWNSPKPLNWLMKLLNKGT